MDVNVDITKTVLETDRLVLRPWKNEDLDDFYEYASVEGVGEMAGWKHHDSIEVSRMILQSFISEKNVLAIVYKENNKVIGSLGFHKSWTDGEDGYERVKVKEIGYVLSKEYWGMGLMPEAVKAVIDFAFGRLKLDAVTISHFSSNSQSKRVIEKCGLKFMKKSIYHSEQMECDFEDVNYILYKDDKVKNVL